MGGNRSFSGSHQWSSGIFIPLSSDSTSFWGSWTTALSWIRYHFDELVVRNTAGFVDVVEVEQDSGFLLERALDHNVYGGEELLKRDITLSTLVKQSKHLVTPQPVEMEKRIEVLTDNTWFSSTAGDVLEHYLEQL